MNLENLKFVKFKFSFCVHDYDSFMHLYLKNGSLPVDTDFSSLTGFIRQVNMMDFLEFGCFTDSF